MVFVCDFSDGASDYLAADVLKAWDSFSFAGPTIGVSDVDGGTLIRPQSLKKNITASACRILGMRTKPLSTATAGGIAIMVFGTGVSTAHIFLTVDDQGRLRIELPASPFTLGPSAVNTLVVGTSAVIEVGVLVSDTVGRVEVRVNGVVVPSLTSSALGTGGAVGDIDTKSGGTGTVGWISLDSTPSGWSQEVDWVWTAYDSVVWAPADWLGVVSKKTLRPKAGSGGEGVFVPGTAWVVAGAATIPDALRDTTHDAGASLVTKLALSGTDADRYSVKADALPTALSVKLLSHRMWAGHPAESGPSSFGGFLYNANNPSVHDGPARVGGDLYKLHQDNYLVYPDSSPLTRTLVNATQFGVLEVEPPTIVATENLLVLYVPDPVPAPGPQTDSRLEIAASRARAEELWVSP